MAPLAGADSRDSSSAVDTALSRLLAKSMGGKQRSQRRGRRYDAVEMTRVDDKRAAEEIQGQKGETREASSVKDACERAHTSLETKVV